MNNIERLKKIKINNYNKNKIIDLLQEIHKKSIGEILYDKLVTMEERDIKVFLPRIIDLITPPYKKIFDYITHKIYFYDNFYIIFLADEISLEEIVECLKLNPFKEIELINKKEESLTVLNKIDENTIENFIKNNSKKDLRIKAYYPK